MKVGFTGTKEGMTELQSFTFKRLITNLSFYEFHHGDCVGSDASAHNFIQMIKPNIQIVIHPPTIDVKRAFCNGAKILDRKDYLIRNKDIVNDTDLLIATPKSQYNEIRSGTWSTIRYAKKVMKKIIIVFPDGSIKRFGGDQQQWH